MAQRQRQPKGVPVGGEFAPSAHDEPDLELVEFEEQNQVGWTGPLDDAPIPQANRPDVLACVVDAVDAGCDTPDAVAEAIGMDKRQGAYYLNAAAHLGLVDGTTVDDSRKKFWETTGAGQMLANTGGDDRATAMAEILADSEYVQMYLEDGEEAVAAECRRLGISPSTVDRRVATIRTWAEFATDPSTQTGNVSSLVAATRTRAKSTAAKLRESRRAQAAAKRKHCPTCGLLQPTSAPSECDSCGAPMPVVEAAEAS